MEISWVRHAEPVRIAPGRGVPADPELTERGVEQAQRVAAWLAFEPVDVVLSSPLLRARMTAQPIADAHGLPVDLVEGLAEYDVQSDHYIPMEEMRANNDPRLQAMIDGRWESFGGEPTHEFRARIERTVHEIVAEHPGRRVVAVCHGGVINVALAQLLGLDRELWFEPHYTSISRMVASRSGIRSVASLNEHAHLYASREEA
jgi:2,3-bisphosphoglycerate-dependent phosphoglycerate mutase